VSDFDLFISYRRQDADQVLPLVAALRGRGLSVWLDQHAIGEFGPITEEIRHGLAQSKALLSWYSEAYPRSRPCQMELTAALLAAQREGDPRRRVLVVNPELSGEHIEPVTLRDAQYAAAPADAAGRVTLAERIAVHVGKLAGPLGGVLPNVPPNQYGLTLTSANRFVGRLPDLWRIYSALHATESAIISGTSAAALAIVSGFGGVGKSLLAEEYALRFGAAYPGGVFWLQAHGSDATDISSAAASDAGRLEQFVGMAIAVDIDVTRLDPGEVQARLGARLSQNGQPFLWIVDDLASGLTSDAVKTWLAPTPLGKTLVTTRSREYAAIGTAVGLDVLAPTEALDLLCSRRAPAGPVEHSAAQGIAQDLGYHPLAVDVSAAALAAQAGVMSFGEFRSNLCSPSEDELELAAALSDVLPSRHQTSVAATILRSVRTLPEEGRDFLRLAALLGAAPIPPSLVVATFRKVDNLSEPNAKRRAIRGQHQVEQASLAERSEGDARVVHALVSRTMRFHDGKPERRDALRMASVAALTGVLADVVTRREPALAPEMQHARSLLTVGEPWDPSTMGLASWVVQHDYRRGSYVAAQPLQERLLEAQRRVLGEDHPDTLSSMSNLGELLRAQGDLAGARGLHERALATSRRLLGEDHPQTLTSMNNLGETLAAQGDLGGARGLHERVLNAQRRLRGEDDPYTLASMNNLALTLSAQGDVSGARELHERVADAQRRLLGEDHPDTLTTMSNLALTLLAQGDLAGARGLHERVLVARHRVLGEDHPDTLTSVNNLAGTLLAQGDVVGARGFHERVLVASRRLLGEDHPATLRSMNNLALTLGAQGDVAGARELHQRVLDAQRRVLAEDHPQTLTSLNNLAETMRSQGNLGGARGLHERVLAAQRRVLGEDHPDTLITMSNLALTLLAQGDLAGARMLQEYVLAARRRVLGKDHPATLTSLNNLAETLRAHGDFADARGLQEYVLTTWRRVLGEDHPHTLTSMSNLAETLRAQGDLHGARGLHEHALAARRRVLGEDHPHTLTSMNNLAETLRAGGDLAGACSLDERVLAARRRGRGEDPADTSRA
jgi:tetratricopeptide (TPR) repeat protein